MLRRRSRLIVPIRDRRQHRRILTLRNFWKVLIALVILFAGLSFDDALWRRGKDGYGRLSDRRLPDAPIARRRPDVVTEAPPAERVSTEPMVIVPAGATAPAVPSAPAAPPSVPTETRGGGNGVAIVGDSGGVTIVRGAEESPPRRVLTGGIFKQR